MSQTEQQLQAALNARLSEVCRRYFSAPETEEDDAQSRLSEEIAAICDEYAIGDIKVERCQICWDLMNWKQRFWWRVYNKWFPFLGRRARNNFYQQKDVDRKMPLHILPTPKKVVNLKMVFKVPPETFYEE